MKVSQAPVHGLRFQLRVMDHCVDTCRHYERVTVNTIGTRHSIWLLNRVTGENIRLCVWDNYVKYTQDALFCCLLCVELSHQFIGNISLTHWLPLNSDVMTTGWTTASGWNISNSEMAFLFLSTRKNVTLCKKVSNRFKIWRNYTI